MAFDVTRQFLGQALQQKLLQQTPAYKQQLLEGELKNRMMAMEMDEMFPLKMQMLQKEMEYMVDPMAKLQAQQLMEYKSREAIENLRSQHMEALAVMRGEQDRMTKATPSTVFNYGNPAKADYSKENQILKNINSLLDQRKALEGKNTVERLVPAEIDPKTKQVITPAGFVKTINIPEENLPLYNQLGEAINKLNEELGYVKSVDSTVTSDAQPEVDLLNTETEQDTTGMNKYNSWFVK